MNALQPLPPVSPPPRRRVKSRPRIRSHQAIVTEITVKLVINGLMAGVAAIALAKLIPYNLQQREELRQLQAEVSEVQQRVDTLQADLDRQLDPQQANSIMQEESYRVDPNQRQVVWLAPSNRTAENSPEDSPEDSSEALPAKPQAENSSDSIAPRQTDPGRYQTASFPDSQHP